MLKDYHANDRIRWPDGLRTAVTLTFDFQGGEDVRPLANGTMNHEKYTQCEYGPNTAIWRLLRILEDEQVTARHLPDLRCHRRALPRLRQGDRRRRP